MDCQLTGSYTLIQKVQPLHDSLPLGPQVRRPHVGRQIKHMALTHHPLNLHRLRARRLQLLHRPLHIRHPASWQIVLITLHKNCRRPLCPNLCKLLARINELRLAVRQHRLQPASLLQDRQLPQVAWRRFRPGPRKRRFGDLLVSRTEAGNALGRRCVGRERNRREAQVRLVRAIGRVRHIQRRIEGGDALDELRVLGREPERERAAGGVAHGRDARRIDVEAVGLRELRRQRLLAPRQAGGRVGEGTVQHTDLGAETVVGDDDEEVLGGEVRDLRRRDYVGRPDHVAAHVKDHDW
jgi:hypothetical protein